MHRGRLLRHTVLTILIFFPFTYMLFLFKRTSSSINTSTSSDALRKSNAHQLSNVQATDQKKVVRKTNAFRCKSKKSIVDGMLMSQSKEDEELLYVYGFDQICGGTYLEMGGLDGRMYSNSYVFHKALDWKGVLVEASPTNYAKMIKKRPNEIANVNAGICGKEKDLHWVEGGNPVGSGNAVSGFLEFAPETFQQSWWNEEKIKNAKVIKCRTLKNVLKETVGDHFHFDFFALDIEGAEYDALVSIDFSLVSFGVIFVEADGHNPLKNMAVRTLLTSVGYTFIKDHNRSYWFVNNDFGRIYEDLIH